MNFFSGKQLLDLCKEHELEIWQVMLNRELEASGGRTEKEIFADIEHSLEVMFHSIDQGLATYDRSLGGLLTGQSKKNFMRNSEKKSFIFQTAPLRLWLMPWR